MTSGRPVLLTSIARVYTGVVAVAVGVVVGNRLGVAPRGAWEVFAGLRLGVQTLAVLAMANTYFVVRDRTLLPRAVGSSLVLGLAGGALVGGALAAAKALDPSWIAPASVPATLAFFAAVPAILCSQLLSGALLGAGRLLAWNGAIVLNRTVLLGALAAVALAPGLASLETVLVAVCAAEWAALAVILVALRDDGVRRPRYDGPLVLRMVRYGLVATVHGLLTYGVLHADKLLIERLRGSAEVGQYGVAVLLRDAVIFLPWIASLLVMPRVAADPRAGSRHVRAVAGPSILIAAAGGLALWAAAPQVVVALHGPEFRPAADLARILVPAGLLLGIAHVLFQDLLGRGAPGPVLWIPGLALALQLAADALLVPRHGATAAAWVALGSAALVAGLVLAVFARRLAGDRPAA